MGAYQQMGHQSQNLLIDEALSKFSGIVASPRDYPEEELATHIATAKYRRHFDVVFDPQMYVPRTNRGQLHTWSYFPSDVDTADLTSELWWRKICDEVAATAIRVKARAVCSPAVIPNVFADAYYSRVLANGAALAKALENEDVRTLQTIIVNLPDLADYGRTMSIASLASQSVSNEIYLVIVSDIVPRKEFKEPEELKGALRLIAALRDAGMQVFVAFSSSDMILWKAAGAAHCGSGKFFNLRRFTRSRFDDPADGGGQLPYWFEESLLAFLRTSDLQRVQQANLLSEYSRTSPLHDVIMSAIPKQEPWVKSGWLQYLHWFASMESRIEKGQVSVGSLLKTVETNWEALEQLKPPVLMEEVTNDGAWVRQWRRALLEYPYAPS